MTPELVIYRGLPGSGKTSLARAWVADDPAGRARVNRDDLRAMLHDGVFLGRDTERQVGGARNRAIRYLLEAGVSVACDDTNLPASVVRDLATIALAAGATWRVRDLTDVPYELCVERDHARGRDGGRSVGEDVIRGMFERYLKGKTPPLAVPDLAVAAAVPAVPYEPRPGTPPAVMVDLDGTLCLHNGRGPYDETRVSEDLPNRAVVEAVRALDAAGYQIVFCSGRTEGCRHDSWRWICNHFVPFSQSSPPLFMRQVGDRRKDSIVKLELFDRHIRDAYDVRFVLDDRQQVVDAWRSIGLTVFQVAHGDF